MANDTKISRKLKKRRDKARKKSLRAAVKAQRKAEKHTAQAGRKPARAEEKIAAADGKTSAAVRPARAVPLKDTLRSIAATQRQSGGFLNLDNAALIFPASETADLLNMFRLSVVLREPVDPIALQYAVNDIVPRFPTFVSAVKRGLFWFYLEPSSKPLVVEEQTKFPCRKIPLDTRHAMVRVTYFSHEISVEFFHVASDGNGGIVFLNSLVAAYLKRRGVEIRDKTNYLNHLDLPEPEEMADSFRRFCDLDAPDKREKDCRAYVVPGRRLPPSALILTKGTMSGSELNRAAKARGLTVTQLLVAALIYAVERDRDNRAIEAGRPVVVNVPANLRKLFPSATLRNFVSIMPIVSDGSDDFAAVCARVKAEFDAKNNEAYFRGLVNYNIRAERNPVLKFAPLPLKMLALRLALKMKSDAVTSTLLSNLGRVEAPAEFAGYVARYEFSLSAQSYSVVAAACATYNDRAVITFSRTIEESVIEKLFFRKLAEEGIAVAVETNHTLREKPI